MLVGRITPFYVRMFVRESDAPQASSAADSMERLIA